MHAVFIYGACTDVQHILNQSNVGLLTSTYEGFPVTLLEYGRANVLVVCSNVGYCSQIIRNDETGFCFESEDENALPLNISISNDVNKLWLNTYKIPENEFAG